LKVSDTATLRLIFEFAVYVVYAHERFHHFCDVMGRVTAYRGGQRETNYKADWQTEEALATAWSWREVQRSWPNAGKLDSAIMKSSLVWWFDSISAEGYRDWKLYRIWFRTPLSLHLLPESTRGLLVQNGCNLGDWLYSSLDNSGWNDASVAYLLASDDRLSTPITPGPAFLPDVTACAEPEVKIFNKNLGALGLDLSAQGLTSLKRNLVRGDFICCDNPLTSLEGVPEIIEGNFFLCFTQISSLENIHKLVKKIDGYIWFLGSPVKSHLLGLFLISDLRGIVVKGLTGDLRLACEIINQYLPHQVARQELIYECQDALIEANLDEYAKA